MRRGFLHTLETSKVCRKNDFVKLVKYCFEKHPDENIGYFKRDETLRAAECQVKKERGGEE